MYDIEIYEESEFRNKAPMEIVTEVDRLCPREYLFCQYLANEEFFEVSFEDLASDDSFFMEGKLNESPDTWESSVEAD